MDFENRKAFVRKSNSDYYTDAITYTKIAILDMFDETRQERYDYFYGDVHVYSQVVGFKKLKFFTNENVGAGDLQLPQREMHSTAFWLTIKNQLLDIINISSEEKIEAVSGLAYLMRHICAVLLMCDINDIGVAVEDNITKTEINRQTIRTLTNKEKNTPEQQNMMRDFEPNIYIYDSYPNGIGFSEVLFQRVEEILENVLNAIERCVCERGCPSCVGPPIRTNDNHKDAAKFMVSLLLDRVYH
jgi:DEAD/DEAH box helicase domain-containing protein